MKLKFKLAALSMAMALSSGAQADTIIDLFTTAQGSHNDTTVSAGDTGRIITSGVGDSVNGIDILGGNRDLYVSLISSPDPTTDSIRAAVSGVTGVFSMSTDAAAGGRAQIQWDGADATTAIDGNGLGGFNLLAVASNFAVDILLSDFGFIFSISAYGQGLGSDDWTTVSILSNQHLTPVTTLIDLNAFSLAAGSYLAGVVTVDHFVNGVSVGAGNGAGTAHLANLGALVADINQTGGVLNLDLRLDAVRAVPEPGVLALLGIGLLGLGATARRNRKQA